MGNPSIHLYQTVDACFSPHRSHFIIDKLYLSPLAFRMSQWNESLHEGRSLWCKQPWVDLPRRWMAYFLWHLILDISSFHLMNEPIFFLHIINEFFYDFFNLSTSLFRRHPNLLTNTRREYITLSCNNHKNMAFMLNWKCSCFNCNQLEFLTYLFSLERISV